MSKNRVSELFDTNKVMRIIGHQPGTLYLTEDFISLYNALAEAGAGPEDLALFSYTLGVLTGKRLDRAKKNHKAYITFSAE